MTPEAEKLRIALAGHCVLTTEIVTCTCRLGDSVPLDGLNFMPSSPTLDAVHFRFPSEPGVSASTPVHVQPAFAVFLQSLSALIMPGLNVQAGALQNQRTSAEFLGPLKVKAA